jgi:hypothetical protein
MNSFGSCSFVVSESLMIAGKAEQISDPQGCGTQNISLHGKAVAVSAYHLNNRLDAARQRDGAGGNARHPHYGSLVIGYVGAFDITDTMLGLLLYRFRIGILRRSQLGCYREFARCQNLLQSAC